MTRVLAIAGPTAVGKSAVAARVAGLLDAEVVSCDSMQVYRHMDIGTAKEREDEMGCAVHMVDVCDVGEPYAVAEFQRDARSAIDDVTARGHVALLCGGTGLYLDAVVDEMSFPKGDAVGETRLRLERLEQERGGLYLHELLASKDPASAREIHPNNTRRVIRALEMLEEGVSYAEHHEGLKRRRPHYEMRLWALVRPREELYRRIDERVDAMFAAGLVDEVRALVDEGIRESKTASQAIGYKEVLAYLAGEYDLARARELVCRNTRRYAKRQLSWLRRDGRAQEIDLSTMGADEAAAVIAGDWRQS